MKTSVREQEARIVCADGLSSPESEEYPAGIPGINGHSEESRESRPSSNYNNRFSADLEEFADELLKKAGV
ncbi:hypothetical protein GWK47_012944 [Chionoecetes opilio]|uniref:Uncharacterized protein n=1 Tax=Chionoecetes opilio TaxID=41210 RepID=A0A8J5C1P0_CHIOP|nr:hypothetical protein GWK47_012944 [Chionoecetes opilio]